MILKLPVDRIHRICFNPWSTSMQVGHFFIKTLLLCWFTKICLICVYLPFFVLFRILELGMSRHVQSHLSFQYKPTEFPTSTGNSLQLSIFFFSSSYSQGSPLLLQHVTLMFGTTKNSLQTLVSHLGGKGGGISGIASVSVKICRKKNNINQPVSCWKRWKSKSKSSKFEQFLGGSSS